jgi:hypothetical protein
MPQRITPRRMKSFRIATPVSIPAQAFDTSKFWACGAPIACFTARLIAGSKTKVLRPR